MITEGGRAAGGLDAVGGDGGQAGELGGEAVHRLAVGGGLGLGGWRALDGATGLGPAALIVAGSWS